MTYHDIKHNAEVNELLKKGNQNLGLLGFTDHSQAHCIHVAETAAHISFVANNQRSRNGVHRAAGGFVMVGNGRNNGNAVRNAQIILLQNLVGQQAAVFRVVGAVDGVADIVHVPGNFSKLNIMGAVVKLFQDVRSCR